MISEKVVEYCNESIKLIENYEYAVSDKTQIWYCHHRLEENGFTRNELIDKGLYYNRPASELKFVTKSEHNSIHFKGKPNNKKPMLGKHHTKESCSKISKTRKENNYKFSGKNNYQWHNICPLQLYVDWIVLKKNHKQLCQKYNCSPTTLYRRLNMYNIKKTE